MNFPMRGANHCSISIDVPLRVRNALAGMLEQMREEDGRQGEHQRCQPDDRKTNDDQFGPGATDKRLDGSYNCRVPIEAEGREREDGNAY